MALQTVRLDRRVDLGGLGVFDEAGSTAHQTQIVVECVDQLDAEQELFLPVERIEVVFVESAQRKVLGNGDQVEGDEAHRFLVGLRVQVWSKYPKISAESARRAPCLGTKK